MENLSDFWKLIKKINKQNTGGGTCKTLQHKSEAAIFMFSLKQGKSHPQRHCINQIKSSVSQKSLNCYKIREVHW